MSVLIMEMLIAKETIGTDEETLSNVYFYLNSGMIELKNCTIGDISGYNYINGKVVKK